MPDKLRYRYKTVDVTKLFEYHMLVYLSSRFIYRLDGTFSILQNYIDNILIQIGYWKSLIGSKFILFKF